MISTRAVVSFFALAMALAGCGSSATNAGSVECRTGEQEACDCFDGTTGSRPCGSDACDCPVPTYSLGAEPAALDFGEVRTGERREAQLRIDNPAPRAVRLTSIAFVAPGGTFALVPETLPDEIPAGGSVSFPVVFAAAEPGAWTARLRVETDDAAVDAVEVNVVGHGYGPRLACSPAAVDFGVVWPGDPGTRNVVCSNVGSASATDPARLIVDGLAVEGDGYSAAWREALPAEGLGVGESATVEVSFANSSAGFFGGQLTVIAEHDTAVVALSGQVEDWPACDVEVVPAYLRFGTVEPGNSATLEFAIRNRRTDAPCTVREIRLCEGTSPAITLGGGPYEDLVVPPAGELRLPVRFAPGPDSAGGFEGCIEILLSPDRIVTIPFVEQGVPEPCALIAPNDVDFGTIDVGSSVERELQIINTCSAPLVLRTFELTEGGSSDFVLRSVPPPGTPIAPGLSAAFTVAYAPGNEGVDVGAVFVFVEGDPEPYMATLRGRCETPPD